MTMIMDYHGLRLTQQFISIPETLHRRPLIFLFEYLPEIELEYCLKVL